MKQKQLGKEIAAPCSNAFSLEDGPDGKLELEPQCLLPSLRLAFQSFFFSSDWMASAIAVPPIKLISSANLVPAENSLKNWLANPTAKTALVRSAIIRANNSLRLSPQNIINTIPEPSEKNNDKHRGTLFGSSVSGPPLPLGSHRKPLHRVQPHGARESEEGKILVFLANGEGNLAGHLRQAQDEIKTLKENLEELKLEFSKLKSELSKNSGSEGGK